MMYNGDITFSEEASLEKIKKFIKDILYPACLVFTLIVFSFSAMYEVMGFSSTSAYSIVGLIQFMLFSLVLCWSREVFKSENMSFSGAHFLHYGIYLINVTVSFTILGQRSSFFADLIAFSLLYAVGAIIALIVRKITKKHKKAQKKANYKKQFK